MRKLLFIFLILIFIDLKGNETYEKKSIKSILVENDFAILLLNDGDIWKVYTARVVEQSWGEWWKKIFPKQPEREFLCNFDEWKLFSEVEIFPFEKENLDIEKYHNCEISNCNFTIRNLNTNTYGFAKKISIEEFFSEVAMLQKCECSGGQLKSEYYKGYRDGYILGYYEKDYVP